MHLINCFLFHEDRVYNAMGIHVSRREWRYRLWRPQEGIKGTEQGRGGNRALGQKSGKETGVHKKRQWDGRGGSKINKNIVLFENPRLKSNTVC